MNTKNSRETDEELYKVMNKLVDCGLFTEKDYRDAHYLTEEFLTYGLTGDDD